jgi:Zn-finger nucleic acid-binding protein
MEVGTMKIPESCPRCGSKKMERGRLNAQVGVSFRPARLKFLVLSTGRVPVQADMCMDCGAVALTADPAEVEQLIED